MRGSPQLKLKLKQVGTHWKPEICPVSSTKELGSVKTEEKLMKEQKIKLKKIRCNG